MKKLLFGLLCFNLSYLWADSISTGTVFFLLPSTNTVDSVKSWATKTNDNWQKADSAINNISNQQNMFINFRSTTDASLNALATSTQNINSFYAQFTSTSDTQQTKFVNFRSTTDSSLTTFVNFRSTTDTQLTNFVNFRSTSDTLFSTLNSTIQAIVLSTSNLANQVSTQTLVFSGGRTLTALVQGTNITLTQSGSSLTVAASGGGSGSPRIYDVVVGTAGMPNVDFTIVRSSDLWAPLAALGANGLTWPLPTGTTVQGKILFVGGPFDIMNASVPAGITFAMIKGSSTAWQPMVFGTTGTIISVYGTLENFVINGSSQLGYSGVKVNVGSGAVINGLNLTQFGNPTQIAAAGHMLIGIQNVSSVTLNDLSLNQWSGRTDQVITWDGAAIQVSNSSDVWFNRLTTNMASGTVSQAGFWFNRSVNWHITDSHFNDGGNNTIVIDGSNRNFFIERNEFHEVRQVQSSRGLICGCAQNFGNSSTGTITMNRFFVEPGGSSQGVLGLNALGGRISGVDVEFNTFTNNSILTPTGIVNGSSDNFFLYNSYRGMSPLNDTGTRTRIIE